MRARHGSLMFVLTSCLGCQLISGVGDFGFAGTGAAAGNAGGDGGNGGNEGGAGGAAQNDFTVLWVQPEEASGATAILAADATPQGFVGIAGTIFEGQMNIGNGPKTAGEGLFVGALNREDAEFSESYEVIGGLMSFVAPQAMSLAPSGSYVAGIFRGDIGFGTPTVSEGTDALFIVKLGQDGIATWAKSFDWTGLGAATVAGIGVGTNTVTIAGTTNDATIAPIVTGCTTDPAIGVVNQRHGFIIVLAANDGSCVAARSYGVNVAIRDAVAANDYLYFVGDYQGSPDIAGTTMPMSSNYTNYIASLDVNDPDGMPAFDATSFASPDDNGAGHIAITEDGIAVMGAASGPLTTPDSVVLPAIGLIDVWVSSLSLMADHTWTKRFGVPGAVQVPGGVAIEEGAIVAGINCSGAVDLGRGPVVPSDSPQACVGVWDSQSGDPLLSQAWGPEASITGIGSMGESMLTFAGSTSGTVQFDGMTLAATDNTRAFVVGMVPTVVK